MLSLITQSTERSALRTVLVASSCSKLAVKLNSLRFSGLASGTRFCFSVQAKVAAMAISPAIFLYIFFILLRNYHSYPGSGSKDSLSPSVSLPFCSTVTSAVASAAVNTSLAMRLSLPSFIPALTFTVPLPSPLLGLTSSHPASQLTVQTALLSTLMLVSSPLYPKGLSLAGVTLT